MNISLIVLPGGLHAIFIRSALSTLRIYEQTVTHLGWIQTISTDAQRDTETRRTTSGKIKSVSEVSVIHYGIKGICGDSSPPPKTKARVEVSIYCRS